MNTSSSPTVLLTEDAIARRARQLWEDRGRPVGQDVEIWLDAERELRAEAAVVAPPNPTVATGTSAARVTPATRPRRRKSAAADDINADEVRERLDDFGDPGRRSPTSASLP